MNRILVVGGSGFLGRALVSRLASRHETRGTFNSTTGAADALPFDFLTDDFKDTLAAFDADTVIMAATVESTRSGLAPDRSTFRARASAFVAACSYRRLVYISTDAVFDGTRGNYSEDDEPSPVTEYGRRSLSFESTVRERHADHCIIRPSYLFDRAPNPLGRRLEETRTKLDAGQSVVLFQDMFKSPLIVGEAARLIAELARSDYVGTVHISGTRMSVFEHHRQEMTLLGLPAERILGEPMPPDGGFQRDTSLATGRVQRIL